MRCSMAFGGFAGRGFAFCGFVTAAGLGLVAPVALAAPASGYHLVKTVMLGDPPMWDYVVADGPSHRVYVAQGDGVTVVDGEAGTVLRHVGGLPGFTHGVAISTPNGRFYSDDGDNAVVKSFGLDDFANKATVKVGAGPDAMTLDPLTGHVFTFGEDGKITVIDPVHDTAITTLDAGAKLEYATADGAGNVYINGAAAKQILKLDTHSNTITARWPVPQCESPHGMAIDPEHHRVFTSCVNRKMLVLNTDTGAVVATVPIGNGTDAAAYDPIRHRVFSSNGRDATLTVIQQNGADHYKVRETIKTTAMARTMSIDPTTGRLFIVGATPDPNGPKTGFPHALSNTLKMLILDPVG